MWSERAAITEFKREQWEVSNKVDRCHLIFDSNSTTYVEKYVIPTKWLKLHPSVPLSSVYATNGINWFRGN